jgi:mycothiol synthase
MGQHWFDPAGFLVVDAGDRLVATCWAKPHGDGRGELYVVAVDPSHHHAGLGRAVASAGLAHLAAGGARGAFLYVGGHNDRALRLYRGLGFTAAGSQPVWRARPEAGAASGGFR